MSGVKPPQQSQRKRYPILATLPLAFRQVRQTWFLLLFIALGLTAAVVIACTIPMLSDVLTTAGLRNTIRATPQSADIELDVETNGLSTSIVQTLRHQLDPLFPHYLGNAIKPDQFIMTSQDFSLFPSQQNTSLDVYGISMQQAGPHLGLLRGQLPQITSNPASAIEVMMTPDTARLLQVHVGSTLRLSLEYAVWISGATFQHANMITAHVVGLFQVTPANAAYWHGQDFKTNTANVRIATTFSQYSVLMPDSALLALYDHFSSLYQVDALHSVSPASYGVTWHFHLDASQLTGGNLNALITQLAGLQSNMSSLYGNVEDTTQNPTFHSPYVLYLNLSSPLLSSSDGPSLLEEFRDRITVARIPAGIFTLLTLSLMLVFASLLTILLIDRQAETVALLRSRGASRLQIFGALLFQSLILGVLALSIGLPLATGTTLLMAQRLLPAAEMDALNVVTAHPLQATLATFWYALAVVGVALLAMNISLLFAARRDVLSLRRETARSSQRPIWQRLNLDIIAGVIALLGYGLSLYVTSIGTVLQGEAQVLLATPLALITPFFLIVGCLLLFLRLFPLLLRLGARLSAQARGAASLLAFAHLARSPRQTLRMLLLLALATAFASFALIFTATQSQHIQDIVTYQTGADFSAQLSSGASPSSLIDQYQAIPGVLSASVGFSGQGLAGTADLPVDFRAVDIASFERTVIWPSQQAYQSAHPLLSELLASRQSSESSHSFPPLVPAIVDQTTINTLLLHIGSSFTIDLHDTNGDEVYPTDMRYVIVGILDHIPTIDSLFAPENGGGPAITAGGVLVDYQTFLAAYTRDATVEKVGNKAVKPVLNHLWLHTKDDPVSLASVRTALTGPQSHVTNVADRRLLLATLQADPLFLILDGVLLMGAVAALLVVLVGDILAAWLSARTRRIGFVALRALGMSNRQITSVLTWEQGIVTLTGLLLGAGFGTWLTLSILPSLTLTDLNSNLDSGQFFALQSALATRIVVPPSLALVLLITVAIFVVELTIMVRVVSNPTPGQTLRLDEN